MVTKSQIKYYKAYQELDSYRKVAERFNVTHPTVYSQVKRLEEDLELLDEYDI